MQEGFIVHSIFGSEVATVLSLSPPKGTLINNIINTSNNSNGSTYMPGIILSTLSVLIYLVLTIL